MLFPTENTWHRLFNHFPIPLKLFSLWLSINNFMAIDLCSSLLYWFHECKRITWSDHLNVQIVKLNRNFYSNNFFFCNLRSCDSFQAFSFPVRYNFKNFKSNLSRHFQSLWIMLFFFLSSVLLTDVLFLSVPLVLGSTLRFSGFIVGWYY